MCMEGQAEKGQIKLTKEAERGSPSFLHSGDNSLQ